ncbi:MAG TPA: hypothetical protein VHA76_15365 [Solirubrobacterales bacterium]|nr:hypothetical protein [Solirubrobacterales bacterium]
MIEDPADVEAAALQPTFLASVLERHRAEAHLRLAEAAEEWIAGGCVRFSDQEVACTAAMVGLLKRNLERRRGTRLQMLAFLETGGWTEAHLDGSADPATVPRPDLVLYLGLQHEVQMTIECKRLLEPSATARLYVTDGLYRFLHGRYATDSGCATMIGFLLDRDPARAQGQINDVIEELLDKDQILRPASPLGTLESIYRSEHPSEQIVATHFLLDIRKRKPSLGPARPVARRARRRRGVRTR